MAADTEVGGFPARAILGASLALPKAPSAWRGGRRPERQALQRGLRRQRLAITYGQMLPCVNIFYSLRLKCNTPLNLRTRNGKIRFFDGTDQ
ncbi:hypothetical protein CUJ84_pRLN1000017 (plasmid) [Rhizobium leguminosarum]|uniref:Uncharacterized protein n=1 Tax=Rhizobium leguminosarum TaxID=384 RepID=A0A2K9ZB48_RHILE|nr:hypothetical protein CUJ84_pRLN1000017 [Rhizobium leguminosarum]